MENTNSKNPLELISKWINDKKTQECKEYTSESFTQEEKNKIREERLDIFIPEMEKEYTEFQHRVKYTEIAKNLYNKYHTISSRIAITLGIFFILAFVIAMALQKYIEFDYLMKFSLSVAIIIGVLLPYVTFMIIERKVSFISGKKRNLYMSKEFIYQDSPYTVAFLLANGFSYKEVNVNHGDKEISYRIFPLIPDEIKKLDFQGFINYVKVNFEPYYNSYEENNVVFESIFYYANEETLVCAKGSRAKIRAILHDHNLRKMKSEAYYKDRISNNWKLNETSFTNNTRVNTPRVNSTSNKSYDTSKNGNSKTNVKFVTEVNLIQSAPIKMCASILSGQEQSKYVESLFGMAMGYEDKDDWMFYTKSIIEKNDFQTNRIMNKDLRYSAEAIIRMNSNSTSRIQKNDIRALTNAIVERDKSYINVIQNRDLALLTTVMYEYGVF